MLMSLSTNRPEFRPIVFREGFNAIVAERAPNSTEQDSRNARGKSTMLMLINYALGGNLHRTLKPLAADGWEVTLELQMFGGVVSATRSLSKGSSVYIDADAVALTAIKPWIDTDRIATSDWKDILGLALFRLEPAEEHVPGGLSTRTLLSYVIRTDTPKDPFKVVAQQGAVSSRQHVSFLLGLDWKVVADLGDINKGLEQLKAISAATREGLVSGLRPEEDLVLERATLRNEAAEWQERIVGFRVLEDPNSLVARADELTAQISILRDESVVDLRMLDLYRAALEEEIPTNEATPVEQLFTAAGALLADGFKKQINDVAAFRDSLLVNRRSFLKAELESLTDRIANRSRNLTVLSEQRDEALRTLEAGGALDELNALRGELNSVENRLAAVDQQIDQARQVLDRREELKLDRLTKRGEAAQQLSVSRHKLDQIADRFSLKMKQLYGKDAALSVTVDDSGFKYALQVTGSGSTGVDRMTLFCFDLTMLEEGVRTDHHPDFLIHDSSVFDGVDPRQRAGALRFAQEMVQTTGGQYICTINSNDIPEDVFEEDWFREGVVRSILDTEVGGLVGRLF